MVQMYNYVLPSNYYAAVTSECQMFIKKECKYIKSVNISLQNIHFVITLHRFLIKYDMKYIFLMVIISLSAASLGSQNRSIEITHYLLSEFTPGTVIMKDRSINFAVLNYNLLSEEMLFNQQGKILALGPDIVKDIDTVKIGERKFVIQNNKFVELLYSGKDELFAEYRCTLVMPGTPSAYGTTTQTAATKSYSSLYAGGVLYELTLPEGYKTRPYINYWLKRDGKMTKFINIKQLGNLYKEKSSEFKAYTRSNEVDFKNPDNVTEIVKFIEK